MLLIARFIGGLGIGGSSVLGPVYIAELAPAKLRGRLVGLFQINIVIGVLLAYFSNYVVGGLGLGSNEWSWQFGAAGVPAMAIASDDQVYFADFKSGNLGPAESTPVAACTAACA